jgi:hypothetical protein
MDVGPNSGDILRGMKTHLKLATMPFLALMALSSPLAAGHHGSSRYDTFNPVRLTGTITTVKWANPHVHVYLSVKDEKGAATIWAVEILPPNVLVSRGITQEKLKAGEVFVVDVSPLRASQPDYPAAPDGKADRFGYYQQILRLGSQIFITP